MTIRTSGRPRLASAPARLKTRKATESAVTAREGPTSPVRMARPATSSAARPVATTAAHSTQRHPLRTAAYSAALPSTMR